MKVFKKLNIELLKMLRQQLYTKSDNKVNLCERDFEIDTGIFYFKVTKKDYLYKFLSLLNDFDAKTIELKSNDYLFLFRDFFINIYNDNKDDYLLNVQFSKNSEIVVCQNYVCSSLNSKNVDCKKAKKTKFIKF